LFFQQTLFELAHAPGVKHCDAKKAIYRALLGKPETQRHVANRPAIECVCQDNAATKGHQKPNQQAAAQ